MERFNKLYNRYVKKTDYKYDESKSYLQNENNLKRMAHLEHTCSMLYNQLDKVYGEEYAEFILTRVLEGSFKITGLDKFPYKEFTDISDRFLMVEYLNKMAIREQGTANAKNLITFSTALFVEILARQRKQAEIELFDFFVCLAILIEKWRVTHYPKFITKRQADVEVFLKQYVKHIVFSMYTPYADSQNITLAILDKKLFQEVLKMGDYSVIVNTEGTERIIVTYDMYLEALKMYFDIIKNTPSNKEWVQPKLRLYAYASNKTRAEVLELIATRTSIDLGIVQDVFKYVNFDAHPQWLSSPEYVEAFEEIERIKSPRKNINYLQIKGAIKEIFGRDYVAYLNVVNKQLARFLEDTEIEKKAQYFENIFFKKQWDFWELKQRTLFSEVTIDFKYLSEGCQSTEEYSERLYKAMLDANAINQMRMLMLYPKEPKKRVILNVKLEGVDEELKSLSWSIMSKAVDYLKSTFAMDFTFQMCQRVYFRDKTRICYEIL